MLIFEKKKNYLSLSDDDVYINVRQINKPQFKYEIWKWEKRKINIVSTFSDDEVIRMRKSTIVQICLRM